MGYVHPPGSLGLYRNRLDRNTPRHHQSVNLAVWGEKIKEGKPRVDRYGTIFVNNTHQTVIGVPYMQPAFLVIHRDTAKTPSLFPFKPRQIGSDMAVTSPCNLKFKVIQVLIELFECLLCGPIRFCNRQERKRKQ